MLSNMIKSFCISFTTTVLADTIVKGVKKGIEEMKEKDKRLEELEEFEKKNQDLILISEKGVLKDVMPYDTFMFIHDWATCVGVKQSLASGRTVKNPIYDYNYRQISRETLLIELAVIISKLGMTKWDLQCKINDIKNVIEAANGSLPQEVRSLMFEQEQKFVNALAEKFINIHANIKGVWLADKEDKWIYAAPMQKLLDL